MKIFITGAVDYIGGSIAERLRSDGHTVRGLVRRDTQAEGSTARSITPVLGDLDDHALLIRAARLADAVINAASSDQTILAAANEGVVRIVGAGVNRWSNVHIDDVTALYSLALERAPAGAFYFAGNGAAIARRLGLGPAQAWSVDETAAVSLSKRSVVATVSMCSVYASGVCVRLVLHMPMRIPSAGVCDDITFLLVFLCGLHNSVVQRTCAGSHPQPAGNDCGAIHRSHTPGR